jgi:GntR family transcriptional regulator
VFIVLSPSSPDPMYKQVADQVKDAIASGELQPNEKLPSIREMSELLEISVITIKRAYLDLEREGFTMTRAGLGTFVADVNRESLRREKLHEYRVELSRILETGRKFGIAAEDIHELIDAIEEKRDGIDRQGR